MQNPFFSEHFDKEEADKSIKECDKTKNVLGER
jgi:hypothetical protein